MKKSLLGMALVLTSFIGIAQTTVFHENFELPSLGDSVVSSGTPGANMWAINDTLFTGPGTRSYYVQVSLGDTTYLTSNAFSTVGNSAVMLYFDHICKIEFYDYAEIEVSNNNGATWTKLVAAQYLGSGQFGSTGNRFTATSYVDWLPANAGALPTNAWWKSESFDIGSLVAGAPQVKIRFVLRDHTGSGPIGNYGWLLDNIRVTMSFSEMVPPVITMVTPIIQDTVYSIGPYAIKVVVTDQSTVDTVYLKYSVSTGASDSLGMVRVNNTDTFVSSIPFYGFGKSITYRVFAKDSSLAANTAQSNQYSFYCKFSTGGTFQIGTGTLVNTNTSYPTPYGNYWWGSREQYLIPASELAALNASGGSISFSAFQVQTVQGTPLQNFTIQMGHTSLTSLPSALTTTGLTQVYTSAAYTEVAGWNTHTFQTPFTWDGVSNLLIDMCFNNSSYTYCATVFQTATTYASTVNVHNDAAYNCTTPTLVPTPYNQRPNMKLTIQGVSSLTLDAGVGQYVNPTGGVVANTAIPVEVRVKNFGTDTLHSATLNWKLDGVAQTSVPWTGTVLKDSMSSPVSLGNINVPAGAHQLKVWTDNPNGSPDLNTGNDTLVLNFFACANLLSGTYTIGGTGANFATFADAVMGLTQCGITGPVVFNVAAGTYNEQLIIPAINGSSATNTITFKSANNDSTSVIISKQNPNSASNYLLRFNGATYVTFKNIKFMPLDTIFANAVVFANGSQNNALIGNYFVGKTGSTLDLAVIRNENVTSSDNLIQGNRIEGGSYAIYMKGISTTSLLPRASIKGNTMLNFTLTGIYGEFVGEVLIEGNKISKSTYNAGTTQGVHLNNARNGIKVIGNQIVLSNAYNTNGIQFANCVGYDSARALVANNFVSILGGINLTYGMRINSTTYHDIYYNSINVTGTSNTDTRGINPFSSGNIRVLNNNIQSNKYPTFYEGSSVSRSNFNNLYSTGNLYGYYTTAYVNFTNLAAYKTATNWDSSSVSVIPYFNSSSDLHTFNGLINGIATPLASVQNDIDAQPRHATTPDIGADEFDPPAIDVTVLDLIDPVGGCRLDSAENVTIRIKNVGTSVVSSGLSASFRVGSSVPVTESISAVINPGDTLNYTFTATVMMDMTTLVIDSNFSFKAWTTLIGDPVPYNDTVSKIVKARYTPLPPVVITPVNVPYGAQATLTATAPDSILWFETQTSLQSLGGGPSFVTPNLYDTTLFWASSSPGSFQGGLSFFTTMAAGNSFAGNMFDITPTTQITLDSFTVNIAAGAATMEVYYRPGTYVGYNTSSTGWILVGSTSVTGLGVGIPTKVPIGGLVLPPGQTYGLYITTTGASMSYTNITQGMTMAGPDFTLMLGHGGGYPFSVTNAGRQWNGTIYYSKGSLGCESVRVPVVVQTGLPPADDAGVTQVVHPVGSAPSGVQHPINVKLKNYGTAPLQSVKIIWQLNNVVQDSFNWVGNLLKDSSLTVTIDSMTFAGGVYCIKSWTKLPNGVVDIINTNDTSATSCFNACLNGTYTIGPDPTDNFPTFTAAKNALLAAGVCGDVVFLVDTGTYTEQLLFTAIPGASATATVTFRGATGIKTDVKLQYAPSTTTDMYIVKLNGTNWIRFQDMTLKSTSPTYGRGVELQATASNNVFRNLMIDLPNSTSSYFCGFYDYSGSNEINNQFIGNHIKNGYYGFYLYGASATSAESGIVIDSNYLDGYYYYGAFLYNSSGIKIRGNKFRTSTATGFVTNYGYGIYGYYDYGAPVITGNSFNVQPLYYHYPVYLVTYQGTITNRALIANNMLSVIGAAASQQYGLYMSSCAYTDVYYNSVNIPNGSTSSYAFYHSGGTANELRNNNLVQRSGGYAFYNATPAAISSSDNNNYYTSGGTNFVYWGAAYANLNTLRTATSMDLLSVSILPDFVSATNLHLTTTGLSGYGIPLSRVTVDIDGDPRTAAPTLGVDEKALIPIDAGVNFVYYPNSIESESDTVPVVVRIKNFGSDTLFSIPMNYYVPGTSISVNFTHTDTLTSGDTALVILPDMIVPAGNRQLCAKTVVPGDTNFFNDQTCKAFYGTPIQDAFVTKVIPVNEGCALGLDTIRIIIKNIGWQTIPSGFAAKYKEEDGATIVSAIVGQSIAPNDSILFVFPTLFDFSVTTFDSTFRISAWVEVPADNVGMNDTAKLTVKSFHTPPLPITTNITIPYASAATMTASSPTGDKLFWYDSMNSQTELDTGTTYTTPWLLYATDTFYVEARGGAAAGEFQIGTGTLVNATTTMTPPAPYNQFYTGHRSQYLILASELQALGLGSGAITQLAFKVITPNSATTNGDNHKDFTVKLKNTTLTQLSTVFETGLTQVYSTPTYQTTIGWNYHVFQTPFIWDGSSNVIIETCFDNAPPTSNYTDNAVVELTTTTFAASNYYYSDLGGVCPTTTATTYLTRPNMKITLAPSGCSSPRVPVIVTVGAPAQFDAGAYKFTAPLSAVNMGANETVKIKIRNYGTQSISNFQASFKVDNLAAVTETVAGPLASGDSLEYTFIAKANLSSAGTTYQLKAWTTVTGDNTPINDTVYMSVTNMLPNYCPCAATSTAYEDISRVKVSNLDNFSGSPGSMYTDFTNLPPALLSMGLTDSILVSTDFVPTNTYPYQCWVNVFIDWNRDGTFDPIGELVFSKTTFAQGTVADTFTVPFSASPGLTRMRVVMRETGTAANTGPCGTFTWGEAEDYLVQVAPLVGTDAGVQAITSPTGTVSGGTNVPVTAIVRNYGTNTILPGQLQVKFQLDNSPIYTVTVQDTLISLDTLTVSAGIWPVPTGQHQLCVWTVLTNDSVTFNDQKCMGVFGELYTTVPYSDDMEGTVYWNASGTKGNWQHGVPAGTTINAAHSPTKVWMTNLASNYDNSANEMLYTPRFNFSGLLPTDTATLKFWHWYSTETANDGGHLQYSVNGGQTWISLGTIADPDATNWYITNIGGTHVFSGSSTGWMQSTIKLSPTVFNGQSLVQFRFRFFSNASTNSYDGWAIDDFSITLPMQPNDVGVDAIISPPGGSIVGSQVTVTVRLKNFGANTQTSFPVSYKVNNDPPVTATWTGSLATNATANYTFAVPYTSPSVNYQLCAYTSLVGDGFTPNNQICAGQAILPAPFDAGVIEVVNPKDSVCKDSWAKPVIVKLTNFGTSTITTMGLQYQINSATAIVETWNGSLLPGDTILYTFNTLYTPPIGIFNMCAQTNLSLDANIANDKSCNTVKSVTCLGIDENGLAGMELGQNRPNPASDLTQIDVILPNDGKLLFEVVNLLGQVVESKQIAGVAGTQTIELNLANLESGVYYYSIRFNGYSLTKKMVIE